MLPPRSPVDNGGPTTAGAIAVNNLNGQIEATEKLIAKYPDRLQVYEVLAGFYQQRAQFLSTLADYDRAQKVADARFARAPDAGGYLTRAGARGSFHHFADALADLAEAARRGAKASAVDAMRAGLLQGMGRLSEALALREKLAQQEPGLMSLATLGGVRAELGDVDAADALFAKAPLSYRDVSPFPVAWVAFQRGYLWDRAGQLDKAKSYYQAALERLPAYAPAIGHLAAIEGAQGDRAAAIARLEPLVATSDDPEYEGQLADLLAQVGRDAEAKAHREKAAARFEALLKAHPEAFADHAAHFYLDVVKDARRAEQLALANLAARQTRGSYQLALQAAMAAKDAAKACEVAEKAVAALPHVEKLRYLAGRAYEACGKKAEAAP